MHICSSVWRESGVCGCHLWQVCQLVHSLVFSKCACFLENVVGVGLFCNIFVMD